MSFMEIVAATSRLLMIRPDKESNVAEFTPSEILTDLQVPWC